MRHWRIASLLAWALPVWAQDAPDPVKILSVDAEPKSVKVGETFHLVVRLSVQDGWYVYSANQPPTDDEWIGNAVAWVFDPAVPAERVAGLKVGEPKPKHVYDETIQAKYDKLEGEITFRVPVRLTADAKPGPLALSGKTVGQVCDPNVCMDFGYPFRVEVEVLEGGVAVDEEYARYGFTGLILLGMLGGLISLIMPCTYPLIPITITYFIKQAAGSRTHGMVLSSVYSLGIISSFTGLGFLLSVLLGRGGAREFAANPWVNLAVALLFLWFTGSLFGWYEIQLPFGLGSKLAGAQRKGVGGAFILGLLFSVVTFTCTIPIAATILGVAARQHRLAALFAMLSYSATMAVPFFLMGLFPGLIKEIPKSGGWLHTAKVTMAWVELGLATYYLSKVDLTLELGYLNRTVLLAVLGVLSLVIAGYLVGAHGWFRGRAEPRQDGPAPRPGWRFSAGRVALAAVFLAVAAYVGLFGLTGKNLGSLETILPPPTIHSITLQEAKAEAKAKGRPLFAEFTGVT